MYVTMSMSMAMVAFVGRVQAGVSSSGRIHGQRRNSNVCGCAIPVGRVLL
jgi:hypothetical protein